MARKKRYFTESEFKILCALYHQGIPQKHALAEINMAASVYDTRKKEAFADADLPKSKLTKAQKRNVEYIFQLIQAQSTHAKSLVSRLDLSNDRTLRWLLSTLYPDVYSQKVAEERILRDDVIAVFDDPSAAQEQASELLSEGDTPDVPGME